LQQVIVQESICNWTGTDIFACPKEKKSTKFCIIKYEIPFPFVGKEAPKQNGTKDLFALAKER
jgi:hypothetical protein